MRFLILPNKYGFLFVLLLFLNQVSTARNFQLAHLDSVVKYIYNFEFNKSREVTRRLNYNETYKVLPYAYSHYWEFLSGNEPQFHLKTCNNYLKYKPKPDKADSLYGVYNVSVNLLQLRVHISRSNYLAPLLLIDDIRLFFSNYDPDCSDDFNMLYWGLYNYYITYARENSFATRFILDNWPQSSKLSGITILEGLVNSESVFVRTEAQYFLTRIYLEGERDFKRAEDHILSLVEQYPLNCIYQWFYLKVLKQKENTQLVEAKQKIYLNNLMTNKFYTDEQKRYFGNLLLNL